MSGLFITLEGMDGVGKSTQIKLLTEYFDNLGFEVVATRDPGGTNISEKIREILLDSNNKSMSFMTETLLYSASRTQLVKQTIRPALKRGAVVICDRFIDSSLAYQGVARKIGLENVEQINKLALEGLTPDITFFLSLPPEVALKRKQEQKELDRMEKQKFYFHKKVYDGYIEIIKRYPDRIQSIDASLQINEVHQEILKKLNKIFDEYGFNF